MDHKEIVEKALKQEDYADLVKDFTPEQMVALNVDISKAADTAAKENIAKAVATRKERERVESQGREEAPKPNDFETKFRNEQIQKAKEKLFSDTRFTFTDADKTALDEAFKQNDSGKVDADLILIDLRKALATIKVDELFSAKDRVSALEKGAAGFNAGGANAQGTGLSEEDSQKYSPETLSLYKSWQKTGWVDKNHSIEAADKIVKQGMRRKF